MSRIYMRVMIHNDTEAALSLTSTELVVGEFTNEWRPPSVIDPGETKGFQGEGDVFVVGTTGTEGRVRYQINAANGGELYVHWNSPLVESQYGNTFHVWAPPDWDVTHAGGQGHRGELQIRLRRTARHSVPRFNPLGRGFAFKNSWSDLPVVTVGYLWNRLFESLPGPLRELGIDTVDEDWLPLTRANAGLCGGMVYAVMDYYHHRVLPPAQTESPTSPDDPLFLYIKDRLWDSFDVTGGGHRYLGYSSPHYPNGDSGVVQNVLGLARGRSWVTYRDEWPKIQADIDAGNPSPIALIQTDDLEVGDNHQVLAYAYEKSGQQVTLFVYDPNETRQEAPGLPFAAAIVRLQFDITSTTGEVHVRRFVEDSSGEPKSADNKRIWCIFRTDGYAPKAPLGGRPITTVRNGIRAATDQRAPFSVRASLAGSGSGGSVRRWLDSR